MPFFVKNFFVKKKQSQKFRFCFHFAGLSYLPVFTRILENCLPFYRSLF